MNRKKILASTCCECQHKWSLIYWRKRGDVYEFLDFPECPKCYSKIITWRDE